MAKRYSEIEIEVVSAKGRYWPGTAIVSLDGEVVAKLLGDESVCFRIGEPSISMQQFELSDSGNMA